MLSAVKSMMAMAAMAYYHEILYHVILAMILLMRPLTGEEPQVYGSPVKTSVKSSGSYDADAKAHAVVVEVDGPAVVLCKVGADVVPAVVGPAVVVAVDRSPVESSVKSSTRFCYKEEDDDEDDADANAHAVVGDGRADADMDYEPIQRPQVHSRPRRHRHLHLAPMSRMMDNLVEVDSSGIVVNDHHKDDELMEDVEDNMDWEPEAEDDDELMEDVEDNMDWEPEAKDDDELMEDVEDNMDWEALPLW